VALGLMLSSTWIPPITTAAAKAPTGCERRKITGTASMSASGMPATRLMPTTEDPGWMTMTTPAATPRKASTAASPPSTSIGWRRSQA
jgi:hypothetical protein